LSDLSNFDDIGQSWIFAVLWWPFWKWRLVEIFQCRNIIIYPHIKFWYRTKLNFFHGRSRELLDRISWNLVEL
jgi:hypothetical protein